MVFQNNVLSGAGGSGTTVYAIDQSIRFNDDDNAYLSRTLSTASDGGKTYTWSWWQKLGSKYGANVQYIIHTDLSGGNFADYFYFYNDNFQYWSQPTGLYLRTDREFRDPSAWYHFVFVRDTTQAVSSERLRLYVNGIRETSFSTESYPALNSSGYFNTNTAHYIGGANTLSNRLDAYMAEIHFLDGYAYDPSFFGEFNSSGIWIPKKYTGSYGTNGFKIDGRDSSDLGDDESGNGNDFTTSGLGAHDQVLDSPTNNFAVLNPISSSGLASGELTGGNLEMRNIDYIDATVPFPTSGKWYYELCVVSKTQGNWNYGNHYFRDIVDGFPDSNFTDYITTNFYHGSNFYSSSNWTDGDFWTNSNNPSAGDIYGFAWDSDTKKIWLAKNNTYFGSGNPAGNSGTPLGSGGTAGVEYVVTLYSTLSQVMTLNFGQDDTFNNAKTSGSAGAADGNGNGKFYYAPPTGFLALCTKNLGAE